MMMLVTYPNHINFIPAKDHNISINLYCYKFSHGDGGISRQTIPLVVLHGHGEAGELRAVQMAAFSCDVGAGALEVIGAVVKGVVMWISGDGADPFSTWLT